MIESKENSDIISKTAIEVAIRLVLVFILVALCIAIMLPFLSPVLWGAIIAITLAPFFNRIKNWVGGRNKLAATIFTLFFLVLIIVPSYWMIGSLFEGITKYGDDLRNGTLTIPPPTEKMADLPLIGDKVSNIWQDASDNLENVINKHKDQVKKVGIAILDSALGLSSSLLMFVISFVIAGVLLVYAEASEKTFKNLFTKLMGPAGDRVGKLSVITIRNVAKGILLVAVIQGILAGIGLSLAGVPYAGLWALLVLILAILQIPPALITIPLIVYIYSIHDPVVATVWAVILLVISTADAFLKPMLMGKGAPVPMLVIFIGAIGGFLLLGFMGLFTGAIILSLGYKLFMLWLHGEEQGMPAKETN
jgi:predicted PurR-regulated permease PerM